MQHLVGVTFKWVAIATRAMDLVIDLVSRRHFQMNMGLRWEQGLLAVAFEQVHRIAACSATRKAFGPTHLDRTDENFGRLPETPLTIYGECAAKFAGPLGVGEIAEAFDDYRVLALQHLGRHGAVSPPHRHRRGTVDTVTIGPAT